MATEQHTKFAALLRRYRRAAGLTQEELAERASLSPRAVSDLERGVRRSPRRDTVDRLADALGLSGDECAALATSVSRTRQPALASVTAGLGGKLPAEITPLVGRERDEAQLVHLLRQGAVRLLTLTGPGGVGKTRLALRVAQTASEEYSDGTKFVSFSRLQDPGLVLPVIASALDVHESAAQPLQRAVEGALQGRRILLLLDNMEHLLEAAPVVSQLLAASGTLLVLVTSREPLHIRGEHEYAVAPLAAPEARQISADALSHYPASTLFLQRARAVRPDLHVSDEGAEAIAEICRRLDGLPLAIELAAAQLKYMAPQRLLSQLSHQLDILRSEIRDLPARQLTMRNTIAWSYSRLAPGDQAVFRCLSVFVGGCTLEAIEPVCAAARIEGEVVPRVHALVDKSLLLMINADDGSPRFRMLETIRAFGIERMETDGEAHAIREAHAHLFLALVEQAALELTGHDHVMWFTILDTEYGNVRAALRWSIDMGAADVGLRLGGALWRFWYTRGYFSEGRDWLERLLRLDGNGMPSTSTRALALFALGALVYSQGDYAAARVHYEESLVLQRSTGDILAVATVLNALGVLSHDLDKYAEAEAYLEESIALWRSGGRGLHLASSLNNLANTVRYQGNLARAAALYEESLEVYETCGFKRSSPAATTLDNLAQLAYLRGEYHRSRAFAEEALSISREENRPVGEAVALTDLANLDIEEGDLQRAEERYTEALVIHRSLGDKAGIAFVLTNLVNLARAAGDYERARRVGKESLELLREIGQERNEAYALLYLGDTASEQGNADEAESCYQEALALDYKLGYRVGVAEALERLFWHERRQGRTTRAARLGGAAEALRGAMGLALTPSDRERHRFELARLGDNRREAWNEGQAMNTRQAIAYALDRPNPKVESR